jgi:hypothetical protein
MEPEPSPGAAAPASPAPAAAPRRPDAWLAAASTVLGALSLVLLGAVIAAFAANGAASSTHSKTLTAVAVLFSGGTAMLGLILGVGALAVKTDDKSWAILGSGLNAVLLLGYLGFAAFAYVLAERKREAPAPVPLNAAANLRAVVDAKRQFDEGVDHEMNGAVLAGYARVTVADLVVEPRKYDGVKVCFPGYYSGTNLDLFAVYGQWGKGGIVWVDGGALSVDKKKDLLNRLDGFHKVVIKGTLRSGSARAAPPRARPRIPFASAAIDLRLSADDVIDVGRDPAPAR